MVVEISIHTRVDNSRNLLRGFCAQSTKLILRRYLEDRR